MMGISKKEIFSKHRHPLVHMTYYGIKALLDLGSGMHKSVLEKN
jgi:hypothetical protein